MADDDARPWHVRSALVHWTHAFGKFGSDLYSKRTASGLWTALRSIESVSHQTDDGQHVRAIESTATPYLRQLSSDKPRRRCATSHSHAGYGEGTVTVRQMALQSSPMELTPNPIRTDSDAVRHGPLIRDIELNEPKTCDSHSLSTDQVKRLGRCGTLFLRRVSSVESRRAAEQALVSRKRGGPPVRKQPSILVKRQQPRTLPDDPGPAVRTIDLQ